MQNTGDSNLIKNLNRKILLEKIIEKGSISRAELSKVTGLNKATVTSQISELIEDGIVIETIYDRSTGGRKPLLLRLHHTAGYAIGVEIDIDEIRYLLTDLVGSIIYREAISISTLSYQETIVFLKEKIETIVERCPTSRYGVVGIGIGIHGIVDQEERIVLAIHSKWKDINLKADLEEIFQIPVYIDNNTNLCAYAEKTFYIDDPNLLCLTASSGIGLGIVINHKVYKGRSGYAGEIGHMVIQKNGDRCRCGNSGCWELYGSEKAFLERLANKKAEKACSLDQVRQWIGEEDAIVLKELKKLGENLAIGINNIINILNPETIVINSELIRIYPQLIEEIKRHLVSTMNDYRRILYSHLGKDACSLGGCAYGVQQFLGTTSLRLYNRAMNSDI